MTKRWLCPLTAACAALFCCHGEVSAGPLPTYSLVDLQMPPASLRVTAEGDGILNTDLHTYSNFSGLSTEWTEGQAIAGGNSHSLLKAYAYGKGDGTGSGDQDGHAIAIAAWRDVAFAVAPVQPEAIRLNFSVDGRIAAAVGVPRFFEDWAKFTMIATAKPQTFFDYSTQGDLNTLGSPAAAFVGGQTFAHQDGSSTTSVSGNWDSLTFAGEQVAGTFHLDIPYDPTLGGFGWGLGLQTEAFAIHGSAVADYLDTASLTSVTLPDGSPVTVRFASGLTLAPTAVPEPASIALLGMGTAMFAVYFGWRKPKPVVA